LEILRAKTKTLFAGRPLTVAQASNSDLNVQEMENSATLLKSLPRRFVFELTNACNLNCIMCGRNAAKFKPAFLDMEHFNSFEPMFDTVEEVTLMGWGEPTVHPNFTEMLHILGKHDCRKYFCTNGMRLDQLQKDIFETRTDVFAVSVDGATPETNNRIRKGSDLNKINRSLSSIVNYKIKNNLKYPWINYVFCAMNSNLNELPQLIKIASDVGLEEVKVVFLTVFDEGLLCESLYGQGSRVNDVFSAAVEVAEKLGIALKFPFAEGADPAGSAKHRDCYVAYRDFFLGSDGFVRPCMSTSEKFFRYDPTVSFMETWNREPFQHHRQVVNTENMSEYCKSCYQSSHCNWNNRKSYIQIGERFAPEWDR